MPYEHVCVHADLCVCVCVLGQVCHTGFIVPLGHLQKHHNLS